MSQTFHLLVALPDKEPVSYKISGDKVTVGRSPDNDIQILIREISVTHCQFSLTDSGYELSDLGSTNGTLVNDQSIKNGKVLLGDRDIILLGETISTYFVASEEGADINVKELIREIQSSADADAEKRKPAVKKLVPPSAVKKVGLPTKKPPVSAPLKPTVAEGSQSGSTTVKLVPPVAKKLSPPSLAKKATPGAPPATPPATPLAPPTKLAPPATPSTPGAPPATPLAPPTKLATPAAPPATPSTPGAPPATPLAPPTKLATPGGEGGPPKKLSIQPDGEPSKKMAVPDQDAEGTPPKLDLPEKKVAPKLNLPPKTDD